MCGFGSVTYKCGFCSLVLSPQPFPVLVTCSTYQGGDVCRFMREGIYPILPVTDDSTLCDDCYNRMVWLGRLTRPVGYVQRGWRWVTTRRRWRIQVVRL